MTRKLYIQNLNGGISDYYNMSKSVSYTTNRIGSPGKLSIELIKNENQKLDIEVGYYISFIVDSTNIFYGRIFTISQSRFGDLEITAYDQLRYLKEDASYLFQGVEVGDIIKRIAEDSNPKLVIGEIESTGYQIPNLYKEEKGKLDIISYALQLTIYNTGKIYIFYDDFGKLMLKEAKNLIRTEMIGEKSLLTDYTYKIDIDKETYNSIKLVRPNEETGKADTYIVQSPETIARWGQLTYYKKVDENLNAAQIEEQAKTMLEYYNRALKTVDIDAIGVLGLRAGSMILVHINDVPETATSQYLLLEKVTHEFKNQSHTMSFTTRALN